MIELQVHAETADRRTTVATEAQRSVRNAQIMAQ